VNPLFLFRKALRRLSLRESGVDRPPLSRSERRQSGEPALSAIETPLRVAIVARRFWPLVGGPEKLLANLAVELAGRGCEITVLTARWQPHWPREIQIHGVPVIRLRQTADRGWGNRAYLWRLSRWLRANRHRYDLVYVSQLKHEARAAIRAVGRQLPVVLRAERAGPDGDCQWQCNALGRRRIAANCRHAAAVIAPSAEVQRELTAAGYPPSIVYLLPNGVPESPPRTRQTQLAARAMLADANPELELPAGTPLAVYVGRLEPGCGLEMAVDAWEPIARRRPNARLWLVGDGSLRSVLRRRIEDANLSGRVALVGVFDQVEELLAAADLLLRPTTEAGTALAVLEAMAAGLPVVASDIPVHHEWIGDGRDGLLVPPDATVWSAAIARVLDDPELAARLGGAARQKAAGFSLAKMADAHLTLFQGLCS
jgi:glycosyltransferase involved in cell wall biosynthesis